MVICPTRLGNGGLLAVYTGGLAATLLVGPGEVTVFGSAAGTPAFAALAQTSAAEAALNNFWLFRDARLISNDVS